MSRETTYKGMFGDWQAFLDTLEVNGTELPHLEAPRAKLAGLLAQGREISTQQSALAVSKQEMSKKLRTVITEGQRLTTAMRKMVAEHYGPRSEKVLEFGVKPFRGRKTAKTAPEPTVDPAPIPTPTAK